MGHIGQYRDSGIVPRLALVAACLCLCSAGNALATDHLVIAVSNTLPVQQLTDEQVRHIYLGKLQHIDGIRLQPVDYQGQEYIRGLFLTRVLHMEPHRFDRYWMRKVFRSAAAPPHRIGSIRAALLEVAYSRGAIGYFLSSDLSGQEGLRVVWQGPNIH